MLVGRRCARRQAVAERRSVGDVDRKLTGASGNPGASGSSRQPPALDGLAAYVMSGIGCWAMILKKFGRRVRMAEISSTARAREAGDSGILSIRRPISTKDDGDALTFFRPDQDQA
jgi:hypothetical protein